MGIKITTKEGLVIEGEAADVVKAALVFSGNESVISKMLKPKKEEEKPPRKKVKRMSHAVWTQDEEDYLSSLIVRGAERAEIIKDKGLRLRHTKVAIANRLHRRKKEYETKGLRNQ